MSNEFWDMLADRAKPRELTRLPEPIQLDLRALSTLLHAFLSRSNPASRTDVLSKLCVEVMGYLERISLVNGDLLSRGHPQEVDPKYFVRQELDPSLLEWIRSQINEEEIIQGIREIRETGGKELADFIHELEAASPHE
jgi:hypothetical protein